MQTTVYSYRQPHFNPARVRSGFTLRWLWQIPVATLMAVSIGLAQVPFTEVADPGDIALDFYYNFGISWGDYDDDGDLDLFLSNGLQQGNFVYRNNGDLTFSRMTSDEIGDLGADAGDSANGVWADIDNDGDLDLFVANFSMAATLADYNNAATAPQPDLVYLNNGNATFTRQSDTLVGPAKYSNGASMADFDGNGFLDIVTPTYPVPLNAAGIVDFFYSNDGSNGFTAIPGANLTRGGPAPWADFDGDGDMDVLLADTPGHSWLYVNQLKETGSATFTAVSQFSNFVTLARAIDLFWGDFDNDGDWDFILNHHIDGVFLYSNQGNLAFAKTKVWGQSLYGGRHGTCLDYDNDGDLDLVVESFDSGAFKSGDILLLENNGSGGFTPHVLLADQGNDTTHRLGTADVDNDGFTDVFLASLTDGALGTPDQERDSLWRNNGNSNHWLKLELRGTDSNRSAVGAEVRVRATINGINVWQLRQVSAGASVYTQNDLRPNFGLGDATVADVVRIEWPSGTVQELTNVAADQILHVTEPPRIRLDSPNTISWPGSADAFELQSAVQANGPWTNAAETVVVDGNRRKATLQRDGSARFYRLRMPTLINP